MIDRNPKMGENEGRRRLDQQESQSLGGCPLVKPLSFDADPSLRHYPLAVGDSKYPSRTTRLLLMLELGMTTI